MCVCVDVLNEFDSTTTSIKKKSKETLEVNELEDEMSKLVDSLNLQENEKMKENKKKNVYENIQELLHNNNNKEEDFPDLKEDDLNGLIDSMMQQLLSRDVLYEPLKELSLKYPQYINGNDTYRKQYEVTLKLVKIFESNNNEKDGDRVQELLEELQALGPPPVELMDSMVTLFLF